MFKAVKAEKYCLNWVQEVTKKVNLPMYIFNDNRAAVIILSTRSNSGRSKHFDIALRYVTEMVENGIIVVCHVKREHNFADMLTHPLNRHNLEGFMQKLYGDDVLDVLEGNTRTGGESKSGVSYAVWFTVGFPP